MKLDEVRPEPPDDPGKSEQSRTIGLVSTSPSYIHPMATRVVSWGGSKHIISPVISTTPSIISIESIHASLPAREAPSSCVTESKQMNSARSETLTSATYSRADATDTSFVRHHKYFLRDGNVTFLVSAVWPG